MINDQVIFEGFFYLCLSLTLVMAILALFVLKNRRRMIFLFLFYAFFSLIAFLLFSRVLVFIMGFVFLFLFILLLAFSYNEDHYRNISAREKEKAKDKMIFSRAINLFIGIIVCGALSYGFYNFTRNRLMEIKDIRNFGFTAIDKFLGQVFENYLFVVAVLVVVLFLSIIWFSLVSERKDKGKGSKD